MPTIGQDIESIFDPEIAAVEEAFDKLKAAAVAEFKQEESVAVAFVQALLGKVTPILTAIPSQQGAILTGLIETAAKDFAAGDITGIASAVIAQATTQETAFVVELGVEFVAAWTAVWTYNPASVTPAAAA